MAAQSSEYQGPLLIPQPHPRYLSEAHNMFPKNTQTHVTVFYQGLSQSSCDKYLTALDVMDPGGVSWKRWTGPLCLWEVLHV